MDILNIGKVLWLNRATGEHRHKGQTGGTLGYAQVIASQTGISAEVALTGLSVTVNVAENRRIKISAATLLRGSVDGDRFALRIKEGTTQLQGVEIKVNTVAYEPYQPTVAITPSAGTHTYYLALGIIAGTGTIDSAASTAAPAFILVEDIGAA